MDIVNFDILEIIKVLIYLGVSLFLVPLLKSKLTVDQQQKLNEYVTIAVQAAEQIYKGPGQGEEKKKYVLEWLSKRGITIDSDELDALIESAVYQLTNGGLIPMTSELIIDSESTTDKEEEA